MKGAAFALLAVFCVGGLGCSSGGIRADFQLKLASSKADCGDEDSGSLEDDIVVRICPANGGECLLLGEGSELLRRPVVEFENAPIDIAATDTPMRVEVQACKGADVIAYGAVPPTVLGDGVDLVLRRSNTVSCGPAATERAFGSAVTLGNGQVLVFGGVGPTSQGGFGALVEAVEVYDPVSDRIERLGGGFRGVFGPAVLIDDEGPTYRIRVFGGLINQSETGEPDENGSAGSTFRLDGSPTALQKFLGLPIQPTEEAAYAPVRDLIYNARDNTVSVEVVSADRGIALGQASIRVATFGVEEGIATSSGLRGPTLDAGEPFTTMVARLGNSVTDFEDGSTIIWGGPILDPGGDVNASAGELVDATGATRFLSAPAVANPDEPAEVPTGFHEATTLHPGEVLIAGGIRSICEGSCDLAKFSLIYGARALRGISVDGRLLSVGGTQPAPAIFQGSAQVPAGWLLTGGTGATTDENNGDKVLNLEPRDQVHLVSRINDTYSAERFASSLFKARFGHAMTPAGEGAAAVFGGVGRGEVPVALGSIEWVVTEPAINLCELSAP